MSNKFNPINILLKIVLLGITGAIVFSGCVTKSRIMKTGNSTYTILKGDAGPFSSLGRVKRDAYDEMIIFCKKQNKSIDVINSKGTPRAVGSFPEIEIKFKCIKN